MRSIPKIMQNYKEGDTAIIAPEHKIFTYKNGEWTIPSAGISVSLMELNEQIMSQVKPIKDLKDFKESISHFIEHQNNQFYIFLQHDYHYITIFAQKNGEENFIDAFIDIIKDLGEIKGYDIYNNYVEIWITMPKETRMFILMPYDEGCVYYG